MKRISIVILILAAVFNFAGCLSAQAKRQWPNAVVVKTDADAAEAEGKDVVVRRAAASTLDLTPAKLDDPSNQINVALGHPDQYIDDLPLTDVDPKTGEVTNVPAEKRPSYSAPAPLPPALAETARTWFGYGILFFGCALPHLVGRASWRTKVLRALLVATVCLVLFILVSGCQLTGAKPAATPLPAANTPPANKLVQTALNLPWLITMSVLGISGGITGAMFLPGPLKVFAIALAAFCAIAMGLTILVSQYALWVVLGTAALCLGVGAYAVMNAKKAIPELIQTVDLCKSKLAAEVKEHLFGNGNTLEKPGLVRDKVQSPTTEAIVAAVRSKTA